MSTQLKPKPVPERLKAPEAAGHWVLLRLAINALREYFARLLRVSEQRNIAPDRIALAPRLEPAAPSC